MSKGTKLVNEMTVQVVIMTMVTTLGMWMKDPLILVVGIMGWVVVVTTTYNVHQQTPKILLVGVVIGCTTATVGYLAVVNFILN